MYSVQCIVYNVQCTLYNVHCTVYSVQCTVYSVQYTVYSVQCTGYSVQCTLYTVQCTVYSIQYTMLQFTVYNVQITLHCTLVSTFYINNKYNIGFLTLLSTCLYCLPCLYYQVSPLPKLLSLLPIQCPPSTPRHSSTRYRKQYK